VAIALSAALSAGCSAQNQTAANSAVTRPEEANITVAAIPADDLAGLYIAQYDGLFARQGLHVTIEKIASSATVIAAQTQGQVDISAGSYVAYISAQAAGARFRILAEASTLRPNTRVLVTAQASHITSVDGLVGHEIGVNGTNSIGTLLVSAFLAARGIAPDKVHFITSKQGFPAMPGQLQAGDWSAAFLAEPYVTIAEEEYGDQELVDLDQGATLNFPIDGYVATQAWAAKYPRTAAAFVRAIEEAQTIADIHPAVAQAAVAKADALPGQVSGVMALPGFPTGQVSVPRIQRVAEAMLQFGVLSPQYSAVVDQGTLIRSMVG
jgi:NitT/TauT family transport system substrate-binding protein